jgi:hypothetical protein
LSRAASAAGTARAERASIKTKEALGEMGSRIRTRLNLDRTTSTLKQRFQLKRIGDEFSEGYTYPDQRTASGKLVESKFGDSARLSHRQQQAYLQLGPQYRVDHFVPRDVGSIVGFLASQPAHDAARYDRRAIFSPYIPQSPGFEPGFPTYFG